VPAPFWSTIRADFAVNEFFDTRMTLLVWRAGQALKGRPGITPFLLRRLARIADFLWTRGYIGADMPFEVIAGPGIFMPHGGRGVVIHPDVRIGARATIYHQVTIGMLEGAPPRLGDDVFIGAGAKVLGNVHLGDGCRVGANAVLLCDVPAGATAVGVPASIKSRRPGDADGAA
jgi:serine O-acetyltransferase